MEKITILVASHKKVEFPTSDILLPIQVGKALASEDLHIQGDNTGDNISEFNKYYCEMSAIYWAWKNLKDSEYIGLCHYRRYFSIKGVGFKKYIRNEIFLKLGFVIRALFPINKFMTDESRIVSFKDYCTELATLEKQLTESIKSRKIELFYMKPIKWVNRSIDDHFRIIGKYYINQLSDIIIESFPNFEQAYRKVMNGRKLSYCNMTIMKKELFNEYCSFIFSVLEIHRRLNQNEGYAYNRVLGYLGEILTYVFIVKHQDANDVKMEQLNYAIIKEYL